VILTGFVVFSKVRGDSMVALNVNLISRNSTEANDIYPEEHLRDVNVTALALTIINIEEKFINSAPEETLLYLNRDGIILVYSVFWYVEISLKNIEL
jgi:hypothetical protein